VVYHSGAGPDGITQVDLFKRLHLPVKKHARRVRNLVDAAGIRVRKYASGSFVDSDVSTPW